MSPPGYFAADITMVDYDACRVFEFCFDDYAMSLPQNNSTKCTRSTVVNRNKWHATAVGSYLPPLLIRRLPLFLRLIILLRYNIFDFTYFLQP